MKVVIIGCGWLGQQLAADLTAQGYQVYASRRSSSALLYLPAGATGFVLDLNAPADQPTVTPILHDAIIICAITPGRDQRQQHYITALQQLAELAMLAGSRQLIHFSSTGIYQGLQGEVDEAAPLHLTEPRVSLLWQGEQALQQFQPTLILRLAGLMGPGRHPGCFTAGKTLPDAIAPINMVHSADIIAAVKLLLDVTPCGGVFNLSCPLTILRQDFYQQAAVSAGKAPAIFADDSSKGRKVNADKFIRQFNFSYRFAAASDALAYCS
ncbi:MAG: epimerase [Gammaproteobacteria bacterium HGW-Gammaproteobacteria-15]|nr:MAG: epimerase [Gammaproteobacteria bacterium HGW-Gammaproteobacteria-15]